jgi:hypothetical protein
MYSFQFKNITGGIINYYYTRFVYFFQVKFTNTGDIIYAVALEQETDDGENYESAFKTFDASDYSSIGKLFACS